MHGKGGHNGDHRGYTVSTVQPTGKPPIWKKHRKYSKADVTRFRLICVQVRKYLPTRRSAWPRFRHVAFARPAFVCMLSTVALIRWIRFPEWMQIQAQTARWTPPLLEARPPKRNICLCAAVGWLRWLSGDWHVFDSVHQHIGWHDRGGGSRRWWTGK